MRPVSPRGKTINRVHKVNVRTPPFKKGDKMFAQRPIAVSYSTLPFRVFFVSSSRSFPTF